MEMKKKTEKKYLKIFILNNYKRKLILLIFYVS